MAYQEIGIGSSANDGTGDSLRTAGDKVNDNFVEVYTLLGTGSALSSGISATATVVTLTAPVISGTVSGDITVSGTFLPAGDTAAGDNAAIGYTSAEGLILTGQGSTNDITIKNDADADVITIATGATNVDIVGDVTASTVNADGDTAAGDNATMGYTSSEGLILTGQGSTNDVTIKNDADADVITIPTGTTTATFAGNMRMTKGGDISSASPLVIDTDGNYFDVTGTTNFAVMTVAAGNFFMLQFDGALTITHGSGIELPGATNLTTAAGDRLICYATAANTVEVMNVATEAAQAGGGGWLGEAGSPLGTSADIIRVNEQTLNNSVTIVATDNGSATGPLTIASGVTVTISSGATFTVI